MGFWSARFDLTGFLLVLILVRIDLVHGLQAREEPVPLVIDGSLELLVRSVEVVEESEDTEAIVEPEISDGG